jgi:YbbR domain-containing protein
MVRFNRQIARQNVRDFDLLTRNIMEDIKNQLPTDLELVSVSPDTISFLFSDISEKKVPIRANIKLKFASQYNICGDVTFYPDSVIVSGPDVLLDTLKAVYTLKREYSNLKAETRDRVELQKINGINYNQSSVTMQIPVSKFTETSLTLPVNCIHVPDSLKMSVIPDVVTVKFMVSLSNYETVSGSDFRLEVDASRIKGQLSQQLPIELTRLPENIYNILIIPEQVSYILEQKP